ncbi:CHRD domain-containing protein [Actinomadura sp. 6N118]|uniref:CHRD domain-containing protein n=1 Tax=Actinomadura sp. 6N118 TaxID=3375151 RepID=UPI00378AE808
MRTSITSLSVAAVTLSLLAAAPAQADDQQATPTATPTATPATGSPAPDAGHGTGHGGAQPSASTAPLQPRVSAVPRQPQVPAAPQQRSQQRVQGAAVNKPVFLVARLSGANEVPASAGDADGSGTAIVRVQGNRVTFALDWNGITAPTLGHIHRGKAGVNGDVAVALFGTAMPATVTQAAGAVTVPDPSIADGLRLNPGNWYVNLHTKENPKGAIRAQLSPLGRRADVLKLLKTGGQRAFMSGDQEVPVKDGPAVGDPDGRAVAFVRPVTADKVRFSMAWVGVTPSLGHIHRGRFGTNGPVTVNLFTTPVPSTIVAVSGVSAPADPKVVQGIAGNPRNWYANLHSTEFPGGAVRGQLN